MKLPRIAIPEIDQDMTFYRDAVRAAGMEPVLVSVQTEQLHLKIQQEYLDYSEFRVGSYDGLLLPGGGDINPSRYGEKNTQSIFIMDALDDLQFNMLDNFIRARKPVIGICRGFQVINVYFGGTMTQHLPTSFRHGKIDWNEPDKVHGCHSAEGSWIASLYSTNFYHNSSHHQGVRLLGRDLVADSHCPEDNVVEALHHVTLPVYGVQWHPERMCLSQSRSDTEDGLAVFQFFSRLCGGDPAEYERTRHIETMQPGMGL